ncbi:MAG: Rne/Rng family ribonuclease [Deltaproteobacteria bacterium]|jgi:ribonuclease G|nr:Rne/Rng family ribonuclease [Deltaproteobacteria bacterium]
MYNYLLINANPYEIRIALIEHGNLVEFYQERPVEKGLVGNIYQGRVVRVLPGMQAAFIDLGLERTGFLYVDDVRTDNRHFEDRMMNNACQSCCETPELLTEGPATQVNIEDLLTEGQEVMVQICKEPLGTKGARLTCNITLPCRNLVYMPMTDHIGISRKVEDDEDRQRLREEIENLRPQDAGFIVRTVAESASREDLEADMEFLLHLWGEIKDRATKASVPNMVYEDLDITQRAVRDLFTPDIQRVIVDDRETYKRVCNFVETFVPQLRNRISLYENEIPLMDAYGIEVEISRALEKKVWLRSGGYIIIETTEALTVVDVNTGRFVGRKDLEETIFKTNMEAVKEIAYQLRLRNIGGIIIIDFIDMEQESHREDVFNALQEAVKKDKSRANILKVSEFGLVQMTRKRDRENLSQMMCEPCMYCGGDGLLKSRRSVCYEIFRKLSHEGRKMAGSTVTIKVHPSVADLMLKDETLHTDNLEKETGKRFIIVADNDMYLEKYEIIWEKP